MPLLVWEETCPVCQSLHMLSRHLGIDQPCLLEPASMCTIVGPKGRSALTETAPISDHMQCPGSWGSICPTHWAGHAHCWGAGVGEEDQQAWPTTATNGAQRLPHLASLSPARTCHSLHKQPQPGPLRNSQIPLTLIIAEEIIWKVNYCTHPKWQSILPNQYYRYIYQEKSFPMKASPSNWKKRQTRCTSMSVRIQETWKSKETECLCRNTIIL